MMNDIQQKRTYCPGSEWLYCKLYSGPKTIERILVREIYPIIKQLQNDRIIDGFFFIRYSDPDYHIRLRFHLSEPSVIYNVLSNIQPIIDGYIQQHVITKFIIDTYHRELERYGFSEIQFVEHLFFIDSELVLKYIWGCEENEAQRWMVCCKYINALFGLLNMTLTDRIGFCQKRSEAFIMEIFNDMKVGKIQMGNKYREKKTILKSIIEDEGFVNTISPVEFGSFISQVKYTLLEMTQDNMSQILDSLIHMHVNRMFRTRQRVVECVLYSLLWRYYVSKMHR